MSKLIMLSTVLLFMTQARLLITGKQALIFFKSDGGFTQYSVIFTINFKAKQGIQIPLL